MIKFDNLFCHFFSVFGGGPLNTLKLYLAKCFIIFLSVFVKNIYFLQKIVLVVSKKVTLYTKTFKYLRYKQVFLDENPKTRGSYMQKLQNATRKLKMVSEKKFSSDYIYKNHWSNLVYEDVVINQRTLMFSNIYWFRNGFKVV